MYITPPWPFWVNSDPSLSRSWGMLPWDIRSKWRRGWWKTWRKAEGGAPSTYTCGYNPYNHYKRAYKWVTGVKTPINGVRTVLITGRGPPCSCFFQKNRCKFVYSHVMKRFQIDRLSHTSDSAMVANLLHDMYWYLTHPNLPYFQLTITCSILPAIDRRWFVPERLHGFGGRKIVAAGAGDVLRSWNTYY